MEYQKRGGQLITKLNPDEPVASGGNGGNIFVHGQSNMMAARPYEVSPDHHGLLIDQLKKSISMKRIMKIVYFSLFVLLIVAAVVLTIIEFA